MNQNADDLFDAVKEYPNDRASEIYHALVGLDSIKERLSKEVHVLLRPRDLTDWSKRHYGLIVPLTKVFEERLPLFIFAGDIGTGKTSLAETFGDKVARELNIVVTLYRLSLGVRGTGAVGQMTAMLTSAFGRIEEVVSKIVGNSDNPQRAVIFLVDEADALAQSRELNQMHHEDRAGVNALIRGIDKIGASTLPVLVVMCTNRLEALDPAVMRRAADIFKFYRPNFDQRIMVLESALAELGFNSEQVKTIAELTGEREDHSYGCTYSDLLQRLLPEVLLKAFPESKVDFDELRALAEAFIPTSPFQDDGN